jgi:20S proteasome subunit beta 5
MNSLITRFASTSAHSGLQKALKEDEEGGSDALWGSSGGFGNLVDGMPTFQIPAIPNVSELEFIETKLLIASLAYRIFKIAHG